MAEINNKNYVDVLIGGKIYTLGGLEEENYLQQVASYLNDKILEVRKMDGYRRLPDDYKNLTLNLNLADDYFKEREHSRVLASQKEELEKEVYRLKAELVNARVHERAGSGSGRSAKNSRKNEAPAENTPEDSDDGADPARSEAVEAEHPVMEETAAAEPQPDVRPVKPAGDTLHDHPLENARAAFAPLPTGQVNRIHLSGLKENSIPEGLGSRNLRNLANARRMQKGGHRRSH